MFKRYWKSSKNKDNRDQNRVNQNNGNQYDSNQYDSNQDDGNQDDGNQDDGNQDGNQKIPYDILTTYEKTEIKKFNQDKIYYCGDPKSKKLLGNNNFGYDNIHDCYILRKHDHIYYRYKIEHKLGNGQYGNVAKVIDIKNNQPCAIKIIKNTERHVDMCRHEINILIRLLNNLKLKENEKEKVILIKKEFIFRNHICIVTNLYYMNLYNYKCKYGGFSKYQIISICRDLLEGLKYLKSNNIIHADLKPENIFLYDSNGNNAVIGDFGLSLYNLAHKHNTNVQTIWYRSPEVVFNLYFDFAIDVWSLGAIIYELVTNEELFKAKTQEHLLVKFHEILGIPNIDYIDSSLKIRKYYNINGYPNNVYIRGKLVIPASNKIHEDTYLKELIDGCLQWEPLDRIHYDRAIEILDDELIKINNEKSNIFFEVPLLDNFKDN